MALQYEWFLYCTNYIFYLLTLKPIPHKKLSAFSDFQKNVILYDL